MLLQDDIGALVLLPITLCLKRRVSGEEAKLTPDGFLQFPREDALNQVELDPCSGRRSHEGNHLAPRFKDTIKPADEGYHSPDFGFSFDHHDSAGKQQNKDGYRLQSFVARKSAAVGVESRHSHQLFLPKLIVEPHAAAQAASAQHGDMASPIASCQPHSGAASQ